jgi:Ion transport protein
MDTKEPLIQLEPRPSFNGHDVKSSNNNNLHHSSIDTTTTTVTTVTHKRQGRQGKHHGHLASHTASLAQVDPVSAESVEQFIGPRFTLDNAFKLDPTLPRQFPEAMLNTQQLHAVSDSTAPGPATTTTPELLLNSVHHTSRFLYITTSDDALHRYSWDNLEKNGGASVADSSVSGVLDALSAGHVSEDDAAQMIYNQQVQKSKIQVAPHTAQAHSVNAHVCVTPAETALRDCEPLPKHIRERVEQLYDARCDCFRNLRDLPRRLAGRFHSAIVIHHNVGNKYYQPPPGDFGPCTSTDSWLGNSLVTEAKHSHYLRCEAEVLEHQYDRRTKVQTAKVCTWYYANTEDKFQDALQILLFGQHLVAVFKHGITVLFNFSNMMKLLDNRSQHFGRYDGTRVHIPAEPDSKLANYLTSDVIVSYRDRSLFLYGRGKYTGWNLRAFVIKRVDQWPKMQSMEEDPDVESYTPESTKEAVCSTLPYKMAIGCDSRREQISMCESESWYKLTMSATDLRMQPNRVVMNASDESLGVEYSMSGGSDYTNMIVSSNDEVLCLWKADYHKLGSKLLVYKLREQLSRALLNVQLCVPSIRPKIQGTRYHMRRHPTTLQSASFSDDSQRVAVLYENSISNFADSDKVLLDLALVVYDMSGKVIADVSSLLKDMCNPDDNGTVAGSIGQCIVKFAPRSTNILVCLLDKYICALDTDAQRVVWRYRHRPKKGGGSGFGVFQYVWVADSQASCVVIRGLGPALLTVLTQLHKHTVTDTEEDVVFASPLSYPNLEDAQPDPLAVAWHPTEIGSKEQFTLRVLVQNCRYGQPAKLSFATVDIDRHHIRQQYEEEEAREIHMSHRDRFKLFKLSLQPYTFPCDADVCVAFGLADGRLVTHNGAVIDLHALEQVSRMDVGPTNVFGRQPQPKCIIDRGRGERAFSPSGKCVDLRTGETLWDNNSIPKQCGKIVAASPDGAWVLRAREYHKDEHFSTVCPLLCDGYTGLPLRRLIDHSSIEYKYLRLEATIPTEKKVDGIESLLLQALEAAHSPAETKADQDSKSDTVDAKHNADDVKSVVKCYATYALLFHACYRGDTKIAMACIELGGLNPLWTPPAGTTQNGQRAHALAIAIAFKHGSLVLRLVTHISSADRLHPRRLAPIMRVFDFADIRSRHAPDSTWFKQRLSPVPRYAPADDAPAPEPNASEKFWAKAITSLRATAPPLSCFEVLADKYPGALMSLLEHTSNADLSHPCMQPSVAPREPLLLVPLPLFEASGATLSADSQQPQLVRAHMRTLDYNACNTSSVHSIWHQDIEAAKENAPDPDSLVTVRARHVVSGLPLTGWNQPNRPLFGDRSLGAPDPHTTDTTGLISAREYLEHHPLDALLKAGLKSAFGTECVRRAVDYKWTAFARQVYLQRMATYFLFLLCYVLATVQFGFEPYSAIWDSDEFTDASGQDIIHSQWVWSCVRVLLETAVLVFGIHYALVEYRQFCREPSAKAYLTDPWNILDVTSCILIAVLVPLHISDSTRRFPVQSVLSVLLWVKSLHYARGFFSTGPFIRMLVEIGAGTTSFMLILVVVLCGFAQAFLLVFHSPDSANAFASDYASWTVLLRVYQLMLGDADMDEIRAADFPGLAVALYVAFTLIVVILMLNLLIALMSSIFERVHENVEAEWYLERTEIILELERSHIQQYIDDAGSDSNTAELLPPPESAAVRSVSPSDNPYLPYLHVLQMVDESDEVQKPTAPVTREEFLDRTSAMMEDLSQSADHMDAAAAARAAADAAAVDEKLQRMQQVLQSAFDQKLQLLLDELKRQSADVPYNDAQRQSVSQSENQ